MTIISKLFCLEAKKNGRTEETYANSQLQLVISPYLSQQLTEQVERKKAFKDVENLDSTNQCDLIGIYRTL